MVPAATHTHTSLVLEDGVYEHPGGDVMTPSECESWVADRVVEAVSEAGPEAGRELVEETLSGVCGLFAEAASDASVRPFLSGKGGH
ncbi:MAG: hypothetical protein A3F84_01235 [Candidatus Handelsmanbacteria bacterium RIFCSPLOWO2_12_FULL_64_10]|uniref:Uncharacterized protein n=1 Tax=Handelsmanbacteria sp. (strain RIFCSPLOWO2_12_FULL_64_10) TaxID=1817868 RepID=A0A1F6CAY3_HANXR|nr:MAG: hypothetical protein A3F84_01235 [Candidatus Handelsmanbacteria bacterium RIFCSPLOWO2_12_FULL_64_10]